MRDMTVGSPGRAMLLFTIPMVLGNLFQQMYNLVDSMVVGNFVGADALAGVGISGTVTFLFVALSSGAGAGASVVISQLFGAGKNGRVKSAASTILIGVAVLSVLLSALGLLLCRPILHAMQTPAAVLPEALTYMRVYFCGLLFLFLYNALTSVFNALGDSKTPLYFLIFSSCANVALDLLFVAAFHMGVFGVALATLIAQGVSAVFCYIKLRRVLSALEGERDALFDAEILKNICKVALPSALQQSVVCWGMIFVQSLVNGFGAAAATAYTIGGKVDNIAAVPILTLGSAMSTFAAQNIGAKKPERVAQGVRVNLLLSLAISAAVALGLFFGGEWTVSLFVAAEEEPQVIAIALSYIRVVSLFYFLMALMKVYAGVLRGAGDMGVFVFSTLANLGVRVAVSYLLAGTWGLPVVWWAIPVGWMIGFLIAFVRYRSGVWKTKKLMED